MTARPTPVALEGAVPVLCLCVRLDRALSATQRRRYWKRARRALGRRSLVIGQIRGLCVVVAVGHRTNVQDRQFLISWLIDQPQTRSIDYTAPLPLQALRFEAGPSAPTDGAAQALLTLTTRVVDGALRQYGAALRRAGVQLQRAAAQEAGHDRAA